MNIAVTLCSSNRCQSLTGTVDSAAAWTILAFHERTVLVVDSSSFDQASEMAECDLLRATDFPQVPYAMEKAQNSANECAGDLACRIIPND